MTDKEQIEVLYREMYEAMVKKATLNRVHADNFVLTHMTYNNTRAVQLTTWG